MPRRYYGPGYSRRTSTTSRNMAAARIQRSFRRRRGKRPSRLAKSNRRQLMKLMGSEKTFYDKNIGMDVSTIGTYYPIGLEDLAQGDGEGNRQGDKVVIKSIQLQLYISLKNTLVLNDDAFNNLRLILVKFECPPQGPTPVNTTDILQYDSWFSLYRKRPKIHYSILMDKTYYVDNQEFGTGSASNPKWQPVAKHQATCKTTITFKKGLTVTFDPGSSLVTKNSLALFAISDSVIQGHPGVSGWCRINFLP